MSDCINGHNHRDVNHIEYMDCAVCGKKIEKHCSMTCQECWDKKHSNIPKNNDGVIIKNPNTLERKGGQDG